MGANASKEDIDVFKKNVTDASTSIMNKTLSYSNNRALASSAQTFSGENLHINCPTIQFINNTSVVSKVFNEMSDTQESTLQKDLQNRMEGIIQSTLEQTNSKFNLFQVNKGSKEETIRSDVYNDLSTTIARTTKQNFNNDISAISTQDISLRDAWLTCIPSESGGDQGFMVKQDVNLENVMENTMNSTKVDDAILKAIDKLDFTVENANVQKNEGTTPLQTLLSMAVMIPVIIGVFLIIGLLVFYFVGKKTWGMNPFVCVMLKMRGKPCIGSASAPATDVKSAFSWIR